MFSNMVLYLNDQTESIIQTVMDRKTFKSSYSSIINNKIPAMNTQIKQYFNASLDAIKEEIYQEFIKEYDFDTERENIKQSFKNNSVKQMEHSILKLPRFSMKKVMDKFNDNLITDLYLHSSKDEIESYSKKVFKLKNYINNYISQTSEFEENMINYKHELKERLNYYIPCLVNLYTNNLYHQFKKMKTEDEFKLNSKITVKFEKRFIDFMKNSVHKILENV